MVWMRVSCRVKRKVDILDAAVRDVHSRKARHLTRSLFWMHN